MELVEAGSDLAGAAIGGAIGLLGGPAGAIGGAAGGVVATKALRRLAAEIRHRVLGVREETRIGATLAFAASKIKERQDAGDEVRDDGFFQGTGDDRSAGEELAEGVLLAAQREAQEKKTRLYGNLLANIAFDPAIDRGHANALLRKAEQLSYRQLTFLAAGLRSQEGYYMKTSPTDMRADVKAEVFELYTEGLMGPSEGGYWLGPDNVSAFVLDNTESGNKLASLLGLDEVDAPDIDEAARLLTLD